MTPDIAFVVGGVGLAAAVGLSIAATIRLRSRKLNLDRTPHQQEANDE